MNIALWTIGILLVIAFGGSGMAKITGQAAMTQAAEHLNIPWERFRVIGFLEILGAAAVLLGLIWRDLLSLAIAGAIGLALVGLGGAVFHISAGDKPKDFAPAAVVGLLGIAFAIVAGAIL